MTKKEVILAILQLLDLPEGQMWVSIEDLITMAEKLDGNS